MLILEITAGYYNPYLPEEDIGLMTLSDFLWYRNTQGKSHPDDVYDSTLGSMNRPDFTQGFNISDLPEFRYKDDAVVKVYPKGMVILVDRKAVAVYMNDVLYYTIRFPKRIVPLHYKTSRGDLIIKPKKTEAVKYLDAYVQQVYDIQGRNLKNYPAIMKRLKIDSEYFTVRTETLPYVRESGKSIVVFNEQNQIVAGAQNEWGATLLRVAREYRGRDLGKILGDIWYRYNPSFQSGGFSPSGKSNARKIWADRVRYLLQSGTYSQLIKDQQITPAKIKEILKDLPARKQKRSQDIQQNSKPELLLYTDKESMFVLYDKKFYQEQDEKYVYAHGFLQETGEKFYIYTLDYDAPYRKLATWIIFQIAYDIKTPLYIQSPPSDHVELNDINEIQIRDNFASLKSKLMNLPMLAKQESVYRKAHDKYDRTYYMLLEIANSKWS